MKLSNVIVGIDQSFTSTGAVIIDSATGIIHQSIRIVSNKDTDIYERVRMISDELFKWIEEHTTTDCSLVFEGLGFSSIGNATRDLAGLQFHLIILARYTYQRKVFIYPPLTVKKTANIPKGVKKNKAAMIDALPEHAKNYFATCGYKKTQGLPDVTDAFWIAQTHKIKLAEPLS